MKGNVLMDAEIIDTEAYAEFARKSPEAVAAQGGRVLVRTSDIEAVQGYWDAKAPGGPGVRQPRSGEGEHRLGRVRSPRRPPPPCDEGPHRGRGGIQSPGVSLGSLVMLMAQCEPACRARVEGALRRQGLQEALTSRQENR